MTIGFPKPLKGEYTAERKKAQRAHKDREADIMRRVKAEDGHRCRVPRCKDSLVEVAHARHRGMGGNKAEDRTVPALLLTLCRRHHSMWDRALMDIVPLTERGMRGPCEFWYGDSCIGRERTVMVPETRGL